MSVQLTHPLILASASPRRELLLREAGYDFNALSPPVPEPPMPNSPELSAVAWAQAMACFKGQSVFDQSPSAIVLGADTVVTHGNVVLGKPTDKDDARRILTTLFGGRNQVITGLAILVPESSKHTVTYVSTTLVMRPMEPGEVENYLESGAWRDKAGAYALQEGPDKFVQSIEGSYSNIVGLPMEKIEELLSPYRRD